MDKWQDKWAWDREHIKRIRETLEPYDDYESFMVKEARENPFWLKMWASQGNVEKRVFPSGLTVLIKRKDGKFEKFVLTEMGEVLDFEHEPKDYSVKFREPFVVTPELREKAERKLAELRRKRGFRRV